VRTYTDQAAKKVAEDTKADMLKVFEKKWEAVDLLTTELKKRADEIDTAFRRSPRGGPNGLDEIDKEEIKGWLTWETQFKASKGKLTAGTYLTPADLDLDFDRRYQKALGRHLRFSNTQLEPVEHKDLMVGQDTMGGYWVTPQMSARILSRVYESSPMRSLATVETISTDTLEAMIDDGEAGSGWLGETEAPAITTTPELGLQRIPVHTQYALPRVTQQLLEDAAINVELWLANKVGQKFGRVEATAFLTGTGVKSPRGLLTYADGAGRGKITQIKTGSDSALSADIIKAFPYKIKEPYQGNASWLFNRATGAIIAVMKDTTTGQYLWQPGLQAGAPNMLVGYPFRMASDMAVPATSAIVAAFGDFREAYTIVDRLGITTLRDPYTAKPFVEFWSRRRLGGDVTNFEAVILMVQKS
jgi:HK97 family phage major capsid protein